MKKRIFLFGFFVLVFSFCSAFLLAQERKETSPPSEKPATTPAPVSSPAPKSDAQQSRVVWKNLFEIEGSEKEPKVFNEIDKPVLELLAQKKIAPAALSSDAVFLRRVFLDLIGTLPTVDEAVRFLDDKSPDKRAKLIDSLLERPEFVEYWTLKWADMLRVKAEFPINLWPNGAMVYQRWIRDSIRKNKALDVFVRELLLGTGSNFRNPPSNFYRAVSNKDPETIAQAVSLSLFGVRFENWPKQQQDQLSVFFSRIGYKKSAEWKEEIVYWDDRPLDNSNVVFPDGRKAWIPPGQDPRIVFADWFVKAENPWFAKNLANRIWFWIFGRGIVHEPDDFRPNDSADGAGVNPPSNPALLDLLTSELVKSKYDFKKLLRLILNSRTYQQSSIPQSAHSEAEQCFACYPVRQLDAEVLQDAFRQILFANIAYASDVPEPFTNIPVWKRTITLADGSITSPFLETFGRPPRDSGQLSERNLNPTASQRMFLINSSEMVQWINQTWRLQNAANAYVGSTKIEDRRRKGLEYVWLAILSRYPNDQEIKEASALYDEKGRSGTIVFQDIIWSLINSKEFLCRH